MPEESGPFNINSDTVARYGLGGLAVGAGGAAALNLVHLINKLNAKRKYRDPSSTDENTIVLTLPKRAADKSELGVNAEGTYNDNPDDITDDKVKTPPEEGIKGDKDTEPVKVEDVEGTEASEKKVASGNKGTEYEEGIQADDTVGSNPPTEGGVTGTPGKEPLGRDPNKETTKAVTANTEDAADHVSEKEANWPTLTAAILAAGGGGALGVSLVNKVYEMKRIKDKETELNSAKEEYLDRLQKGASTPFLDELFSKEAVQAKDPRTFSLMDYPMGLGALFLLLGSGGTSYITKRILDEGTKSPEVKPPKPTIKRIVFQSGNDKTASAEDPAVQETIDATVGIFTDIVSGQPDVLMHEKCASYFDANNIKASDIYKEAQGDFDNLVSRIYGDDDLRKTIQRAYLDTHPIGRFFKWGLGVPGIKQLADRSMYQKLQETFKPQSLVPPAIPSKYKTAADKQAFLGSSLADIASSFYGSTIANQAENLTEEEQAAAEAEAQADPAAETPEDRAARILSGMEIHAKDPKAAKFVQMNRDRILNVLNGLAQEDKI